MPGRSCLSLLAVFLVSLLLPPTVNGQVSRASPTPDFGLPTAIVGTVVSPPSAAPLPPARPPSSRPNPVAPIAIGLRGLTDAAGTIFSGTVMKIARQPATQGSIQTVAISFHVEQALRGATPGQDITIKQWLGLWTSGQRYHVGERVLLFLYPPSKLGLTSTVAGPIGRFTVDPLSHILFTPQHLPITAADPILAGKSRVSWNEFAHAAVRAGLGAGLKDDFGIAEFNRTATRLP
jgi:hypothetical protein